LLGLEFDTKFLQWKRGFFKKIKIKCIDALLKLIKRKISGITNIGGSRP
jgi:hypothetical protein